MTHDEIIRMAQTCGFSREDHHAIYGILTRFAELVAAAEREACARLCDIEVDPTLPLDVSPICHSYVESAKDCAAAIRARGNT